MSDSECVTRREFDRLERSVEKQSETVDKLVQENVALRVHVDTIMEKLDGIEAQLGEINNTISNNKAQIARVLAFATFFTGTLSYVFTRIFMRFLE